MLGNKIIFLALIVFAVSCKENTLFDSGENIIDIVKLDPFEKIEIKDIFDIVLLSDTADFIIIKCGKNLLQNIDINQDNKLINLTNNNKYHWSRKYKKVNLEIHSTQLKTIIIREPITLITKGIFKGESIRITDWSKISIVDMVVDVKHVNIGVSSNNTGEYTIKGKTEDCYLRAWGSCFYFTEGLESNNCFIRHDGIGDVYVNVNDNLTVHLNTYGNVYYKGTPNINKIQNSSGSLFKID